MEQGPTIPRTPAKPPGSPPLTRKTRVKPTSRIMVNVTTPRDLITTLEGISKKVGDIAIAQQEERDAQKENRAKVNATPMKVEIINRQKNPIFGSIVPILTLISLVVLLVLVFFIWHTLSTTTTPLNQTSKTTPGTMKDIHATKNEMSALKEKSESNVASLRNELATTAKLGTTKDEMTKLENRLESKMGLAKEEVKKLVVDEVKKIVPPNPTKEAVVVPAVPRRVNILLVDSSGNVPECFKGVFVSDILQQGKNTHFPYRNEHNEIKFVDWNQVMFSYPYTDDPCITGTIYCTPEIAGAASKAIGNVPSHNVYRDEKTGTIRYDNLIGGFPLAIGYVTAQHPLPTQP